VAGCCKYGYEPSGFIKYGEFVEKLGNCRMRNNYSHAAQERELSVRSDSSRDVHNRTEVASPVLRTCPCLCPSQVPAAPTKLRLQSPTEVPVMQFRQNMNRPRTELVAGHECELSSGQQV
jgi:hypothetical protein